MQFDLARATEVLGRTPATLRSLLEGIGDDWSRASEGAGTWTPFDIVGHLIHGERSDWIERARIILAQGESRTFTPFDREAQFEASQGRTLEELLDTFAELRAANVEALAAMNITDEQLDLTGEHPALGTATLRQLLATWVAHDLGHLAQIARVMAKQYRDEVGPWAAYLPILSVESGRGD